MTISLSDVVTYTHEKYVEDINKLQDKWCVVSKDIIQKPVEKHIPPSKKGNSSWPQGTPRDLFVHTDGAGAPLHNTYKDFDERVLFYSRNAMRSMELCKHPRCYSAQEAMEYGSYHNESDLMLSMFKMDAEIQKREDKWKSESSSLNYSSAHAVWLCHELEYSMKRDS